MALVFALLAPLRAHAALPTGFSATPLGSAWVEPVGITFDDNGRGYVWERGGRVWILDGATKLPTPLIDLSEEVLAFRDHGLLGFALHPNFLANGYVYLFYAVDRHHLFFAGTPGYDPGANDFNGPSIARITRYTATAASGFTSVDPGSRLVLLGESPSTGCPLVHSSHGAGALAFGVDGSLLATCGDGASFQGMDDGGPEHGSFAPQALTEGILAPAEDVGAFRSQLLSSHSGKLLRLDAETGDGLPSNPYYQAAQPRSARSRTFLLGLRNAFRFTLRPETGEHDPELANPGAIYLGDVGWNTWDELAAYTQPGRNLGWPVFEGMFPQGEYVASPAQNPEAPNPLFGQPGCTTPFFRFVDLIVQETLAAPSFPNPCNPAQQIPASAPRHVHRRPDFAYGHGMDLTYVRAFSGTTAIAPRIVEAGSPVSGPEFSGSASVGGVWYTGSDFPPEYQNTYFHADYARGWIQLFRYDSTQTPFEVEEFWPDAGAIVALATSPVSGGLYAVDIASSSVLRISFGAGVNQPPVAQASANVRFGTTPLQVTFSSTGSLDPEGQPLSYSWSFDDGTAPATTASAVHTFSAPAGVPTRFDVTLTVTDSALQSASFELPIWLNNTPPQVAITSPVDQSMYGLAGQTTLPLAATFSDLEHGVGLLSCAWQVVLHHNTHTHPDPVITSCSSSAVVDPIGCDGNTYYFRFQLSVSDPLGLSTTRDVAVHPDCASLVPVVCGDLDANGARNAADVSLFRAALANPTGSPLSPTALARCSGIGGAECDLADLSVLRRYLLGRAPGPLPVCPAAP